MLILSDMTGNDWRKSHQGETSTRVEADQEERTTCKVRARSLLLESPARFRRYGTAP